MKTTHIVITVLVIALIAVIFYAISIKNKVQVPPPSVNPNSPLAATLANSTVSQITPPSLLQ